MTLTLKVTTQLDLKQSSANNRKPNETKHTPGPQRDKNRNQDQKKSLKTMKLYGN